VTEQAAFTRAQFGELRLPVLDVKLRLTVPVGVGAFLEDVSTTVAVH